MRIGLLILLSLISCAGGFAQQITFTASAPGVVEVGEQFRLVYRLNKADASNLRVPSVDGLVLLAGPSPSRSSSVSIINGNVTQVEELTYTYIYEAEEEGEITVAEAIITVDGKDYTSNPLKIKVVKNSGGGSAQQNQQNQQNRQGQQQGRQQSGQTGNVSQDDLFLRLEVSRNSLYVGESLVATLKVYSRVGLSGFGQSKFPAFDGFLSEEVPTGQIRLERAEYNGKVYETGVLYQRVLFPQHAGEITIEPFQVECVVRQRVTNRSNDFFDSFFGNVREVNVIRRTPAVKINVKALPESGKPRNFGGMVGNLSMSTSMSPDTLKANDALTYKVTFRGTGNLKLMEAPKINFPHDFDVYDPKVNRDIRTSGGTNTGTVTFEYLVIPRYGGDYTIPAVNYAYFDTRSGSYKTLSGSAYPIHVIKGAEGTPGSGEAALQSFKKEDVRVIGEDIRFIRTGDLELQRKGVSFYHSLAYVFSFILPFLLCLIGMLVNRRRIKANADLVRVKSKAANKMARKRLQSASGAMRSGDSARFYQEVLTALWGYMSYKLNINASDLNRDNISDHLNRRNVPDEQSARFIELLDTCEFARYAPGSDRGQEMEKVYTESVDVITGLDRML